MNEIRFVESAVSQLLNLKGDSQLNSSMRDQIDCLLSELEFLQLYVLCLAKWNEVSLGKKNKHLGVVNSHIKGTLAGATKDLYNTGATALATQDFQDWNNLVSELQEKIQCSKPKIGKDTQDLLKYSSSQCRFSNSELKMFHRSLSNSLDKIVRPQKEEILDKIQGFKENLQFFDKIYELTREVRSSNKDLKDFNIRIQVWAYKAACLSLFYRVLEDENREEMPIFFSTPEVTTMFLASLKHLWTLSHNRFLMDEGVPKFVDFLLEILQLCSLKDGIQNLRSKLIFLTTFLLDPPVAEEHKKDVDSISKELWYLICSLNANQIEEGTAEDFQEKLETVTGKVSELYAHIFLDSTSFDFPKINVSGCIDLLTDDLREISHSVPKHQVDEILEVLSLLRSFVSDNKKMDLPEDLWRRMVNVVYRVKIFINMFSYMSDCLWYNMKFLWDVKEEIILVNSELKMCQNQQHQDTVGHNSEFSSLDTLRFQEFSSHDVLPLVDNKLTTDEAVLFKDDFDILVDQLLSGERFKIVTVYGLPGQGKTTLARKVYNHPSVSNHFNVCVWCTVSQTYQMRSMLFEILDMISSDLYVRTMEDEDLAYILYRSLKWKRYLIVLDDVWDSGLLADLRYSFPDDEIGSRILVTSRYSHLDKEANLWHWDRYAHHLSPLSDSDGWNLLQKILFQEGECPPTFAEVGNRIVKGCKGIPLAITVIAGLLLKRVNDLDWWKQIAKRTGGSVHHIFESSYKQLPENLKPCFLYLGAFQESKVIRARRLIQLWVSEGLVHNSDGSDPEEVAKAYLMDLVSRSLVMVADRSSTNGIKTCQLHSLIYEFCLAKGKEENFVETKSGDLFLSSKGTICKNYRICIENGADGFFASNPLGPCVHSLLFVPDYTCFKKGDLFAICNFKLLHVFDLEDMEFNGYFPEEVTLLVLLRYLAIWCPGGKISVPPSIAKLKNLEIFRVRRVAKIGNEICLPDTLWKMKRLRHVDVGGFTFTAASFSSDSEPDDEQSLALKDIQKFSSPSFSCGKDADALLGRLKKVRKLRCQFNDTREPYQSGFPIFGVLSELESLNLRYLGSHLCPFAFNLPLTLRKLTLAQCRISWSEMPRIVENLYNLEVLKLLKDAFVGEEWVLIDDHFFTALKFLKLCELDIAQWIASADAFPCLQQLIVESCYELEEIPLEFGVIPTLREIQVHWCKPTVGDSAREIKEQDFFGYNDFKAEIY